MLTSAATGWNPNQAQYATASSISGPWTGLDQRRRLHHLRLPADVRAADRRAPRRTSYLYLGDRWAGAWGGPVNDSQYVWLPITFPTSTSMSMSWYPQITIDAAAGTVTGIVAHLLPRRPTATAAR